MAEIPVLAAVFGRMGGKVRPPHLLVTGRGYGQAEKEPDLLKTSAPTLRTSRITPLKLGRP